MKQRRLLLATLFVFSIFASVQAANYTIDSANTIAANDNPSFGLSNGDSLIIHGVFVMNTNYSALQNTRVALILDGPQARIHWTGNYALRLGTGSSMTFYNGSDLTVSGPCNNNKSIYFGSVEVAACVGGNNGVLNFDEIVYAGGIDSTGSVLPVHWLSSEAQSIGMFDVEVKWSTAMEENNSHFNIEYSIDGINWNLAGAVNSKALSGNSNSILDYSYTFNVLERVSYIYVRVVQVDFNGDNSSTDVMPVKFKEADGFVVKTLGNNAIQIENINSNEYAEVTLNVYDLNGKLITAKDFSDTLYLKLDQNGVYILEWVTPQQILIKKHLVR
ncbi:hypothetical protein GYB22_01650 [bacterium]|nr:hypothetical protein [bacterium]